MQQKERDILMTPQNICAIFEGRKTNTRRLVQPQPYMTYVPTTLTDYEHDYVPVWRWKKGEIYANAEDDSQDMRWLLPWCPQGQPGDTLRVREAWAVPAAHDQQRPANLCPATPVWYLADGPKPEGFGRTRSPLHMPRWAVRLRLQIISVHIERLQDISEPSAIAEGLFSTTSDDGRTLWYGTPASRRWPFPWAAFSDLWDSIHAPPHDWRSDPWVWAISFERIGPFCTQARARMPLLEQACEV
jgi:hypothetical protein